MKWLIIFPLILASQIEANDQKERCPHDFMRPAKEGEFAWNVVLIAEKNEIQKFLCGGSIISKNLVSGSEFAKFHKKYSGF